MVAAAVVVSLVALDPQDLLPPMDLQEEAALTKGESALQPIATTDEYVASPQTTVSANLVACQATHPSTRPGKPLTDNGDK
jgi:hypothetical protein